MTDNVNLKPVVVPGLVSVKVDFVPLPAAPELPVAVLVSVSTLPPSRESEQVAAPLPGEEPVVGTETADEALQPVLSELPSAVCKLDPAEPMSVFAPGLWSAASDSVSLSAVEQVPEVAEVSVLPLPPRPKVLPPVRAVVLLLQVEALQPVVEVTAPAAAMSVVAALWSGTAG